MDTVPNRQGNIDPKAGADQAEELKARNQMLRHESTGLSDDPWAEMDAAFGYGTVTDELTEREIDELYVQEMIRRDNEAQSRDRADSGRGAADAPARPIRHGHFSRYSADILIALITAAYEDHPVLIELGYIDTPERKLRYLDEAWREVRQRLSGGQRAA
jgi:hypothetical protein